MRRTIIRDLKEEAGMAGTRKVIDCRQFPRRSPVRLRFWNGRRVINLAVFTPPNTVTKIRRSAEQIRSMLQDDSAVEEAA